MMPAFCLEMHAPWRCRHTGACCSAGWTIPIEWQAFERVSLHFRGRVGDPLFRTGGPLPEGAAAIVGVNDDRGCVFFDSDGSRQCAVHRELGMGSLPLACRQFPRQVLEDGRGMFITLSHYCPTAARLLVEKPAFAIVPAPQNLRLDDELEGLHATDALPPLLKPDLLTDLPGYDAWERGCLGTLDTHPGTAGDALNAIAAATKRLERWRPGAGTLTAAVTLAFADSAESSDRVELRGGLARLEVALASVPPGIDRPATPAVTSGSWRDAVEFLDGHSTIVRAYLASKLFGNWIAYHGRALGTVVEYLRVCLDVLTAETIRLRSRDDLDDRQQLIESIRATDLLMVHLVDVPVLTRRIDTP